VWKFGYNLEDYEKSPLDIVDETKESTHGFILA
jgi:hypothetical protein